MIFQFLLCYCFLHLFWVGLGPEIEFCSSSLSLCIALSYDLWYRALIQLCCWHLLKFRSGSTKLELVQMCWLGLAIVLHFFLLLPMAVKPLHSSGKMFSPWIGWEGLNPAFLQGIFLQSSTGGAGSGVCKSPFICMCQSLGSWWESIQ